MQSAAQDGSWRLQSAGAADTVTPSSAWRRIEDREELRGNILYTFLTDVLVCGAGGGRVLEGTPPKSCGLLVRTTVATLDSPVLAAPNVAGSRTTVATTLAYVPRG